MTVTGGPQPQWLPRPAPATPPYGSPAPPPVNHLALAAFVCSLLGLTLLPLAGGLVGAGLGAAALARMRAHPGGQGRGLAQAAVVIGLVLSVVPLALITFLDNRLGHGGPAVSVLSGAVFAYGAGVALVAFRGSSRRERTGMAAGLLGGTVAVVTAAVLAVLMAYALFYGVKALVRYTGHQVRCAVTQAVHPDPTCPRPARTP